MSSIFLCTPLSINDITSVSCQYLVLDFLLLRSRMFFFVCFFYSCLLLFVIYFPVDIEAQILEIQGMKATLLEEGEQGVGLDSTGFYDQEIYGGSDSRFAGYVTSIAANEQEDVSFFPSQSIDTFVMQFPSPR